MIEYLYEYLKNPWNVHTVNTASISLQYNVYLICLDTIFYKEEEKLLFFIFLWYVSTCSFHKNLINNFSQIFCVDKETMDQIYLDSFARLTQLVNVLDEFKARFPTPNTAFF